MSLDINLANNLVRDRVLATGDAVLVGVSGGPDSVALLQFLHEIGPALGLRLEVAHVDHGTRGHESREDGEFVRRIAAKLSLPFHFTSLELARSDRDRGSGNLEALARERRYQFFAQVAAKQRIGKVAVAHHRGDQVETMLMWLLRGCGPEGLAGMPAVRLLARDVPGAEETLLVRPLLEVSREDILEYLEREGLDFREDHTNYDARYLRNWIRQVVLPGFRRRVGHGLERRLARLTGMLRSDHALLERQVVGAYPRVVRDDALGRAAFLGLEPELQARMVRFWLNRRLGTLRRIGVVHVDAVLHAIGGTRPHASVSLPGAWKVVREYESVRLIRSASELQAEGSPLRDYSYRLPLEGELVVPEAGVQVTAWCSTTRQVPESNFEAGFDLDRLKRDGGQLRLRNLRPGDRLRPLGMTGHKKLKDLFIEKKTPRSWRRTVPLLLVGEEIVWVPGYARSEFAKVESGTRAVWRIKVSEGCGMSLDGYQGPVG